MCWLLLIFEKMQILQFGPVIYATLGFTNTDPDKTQKSGEARKSVITEISIPINKIKKKCRRIKNISLSSLTGYFNSN